MSSCPRMCSTGSTRSSRLGRPSIRLTWAGRTLRSTPWRGDADRSPSSRSIQDDDEPRPKPIAAQRKGACVNTSAPPPPSTWRVAAYTRWEQLDDELCRLPADKKATADYRIAARRLEEAKQAFEASYKPSPPKYFYSGARIEQTWSCLHEAERALLMLLDKD